jgi:hypothetical protein
MISAFYGMEIPYGKREFIAEEEEQQQTAAQPPAPPPPIEEQSIQVTQENCHAPPAHKMVVVQEQHSHVHLLVRRNISIEYFNDYLIFRLCKKIMNLFQNGLKHKNHHHSMLKYMISPFYNDFIICIYSLETINFIPNAQSSSATSTIDYQFLFFLFCARFLFVRY